MAISAKSVHLFEYCINKIWESDRISGVILISFELQAMKLMKKLRFHTNCVEIGTISSTVVVVTCVGHQVT